MSTNLTSDPSPPYPGAQPGSAPIQQEGMQLSPPAQQPIQATNNAFKLWVKNNEIAQETARHLISVLTRVKIVMLVDDSSSMGQNIVEPGAQTNLFANTQNQKTRWMEAQQAAVALVNMITALPNQHSFDVWFLNRGKVLGVNKPNDLQAVFNAGPYNGTPLVSTLSNIFNTYSNLTNQGIPVLTLVLSDGEPSGSINETIDNLYSTLYNKPREHHVSFIECNDNEEEMIWMDALDGRVFNFHNSDDYRLELQRVKAQQGSSFKYTYTDYIISAVLSTFIPAYFMLDQNKAARCSISTLPTMSQKEIDSHLEGVAFVDRKVGDAQFQPGKYQPPPQQGYQAVQQPVYIQAVPPSDNSDCCCCTIV